MGATEAINNAIELYVEMEKAKLQIDLNKTEIELLDYFCMKNNRQLFSSRRFESLSQRAYAIGSLRSEITWEIHDYKMKNPQPNNDFIIEPPNV